jgi:hypothetical protein
VIFLAGAGVTEDNKRTAPLASHFVKLAWLSVHGSG